jgi:predicted NBD/HSP70 family sugar kinase
MRYVGIDIGGSKIRGILWNGRRVLRAHELPTPDNEKHFARAILELVSTLARQEPFAAIGIGAAGIIQGTTLLSSPNIPFIKEFNFRVLWPRSIPLRVDNDARCFARAELLRGARRRAESLFALTIGTGVGRAYGKIGKVIRLKEFEYPEPWEKEYQEVRNKRDVGELADFLGDKLAPLLQPFKPTVIVIGGGVMERREFPQKLRRSIKAHGLQAQIGRARLGKNAVAIGAALLFKD